MPRKSRNSFFKVTHPKSRAVEHWQISSTARGEVFKAMASGGDALACYQVLEQHPSASKIASPDTWESFPLNSKEL